jgi:hypothetical protein
VDIGGLLLGVFSGFLAVFLLADVPGRVNRKLDPAVQEKLNAAAGGLMALNSRRTHITFGIVFLILALILIISSV